MARIVIEHPNAASIFLGYVFGILLFFASVGSFVMGYVTHGVVYLIAALIMAFVSMHFGMKLFVLVLIVLFTPFVPDWEPVQTVETPSPVQDSAGKAVELPSPTSEFSCFGAELRQRFSDGSWQLIEVCDVCENSACVVDASPPVVERTLTADERAAFCSDVQGLILVCVAEKNNFDVCAERALTKVQSLYGVPYEQVVGLAQQCIAVALG